VPPEFTVFVKNRIVETRHKANTPPAANHGDTAPAASTIICREGLRNVAGSNSTMGLMMTAARRLQRLQEQRRKGSSNASCECPIARCR
jgi:hypothetical protein